MESNLTILFAMITKLDLNMAAAIFDFFKSTPTQRDALKRVAKLSKEVSPEQRTLLNEVMKEYEGLAQRRNEIAHNPYGFQDTTQTKVYLMLKTKGLPGPEGIPYMTRLIEVGEIDQLTADIHALRVKLLALIRAVGKFPTSPQNSP